MVGDNSGTTDVATGSDTPDTSTPDVGGQQEAARPTVRAEAAGLSTLVISTTPLRPSDAADSGGWFDHTVTMNNTGLDPVHLDDFRTGAVLGDREVLVATDGCGYGSVLSESAVPACRQNYQAVTIEAGGTYQFDVTLWRDLEGMNPVTVGSYRWDIEIRVGSEPFADPRTSGGEIATLTVHYDGLAETANDEGRTDGPDPLGGLDGSVMYAPASHSDRMELAQLTGVLGRAGDCLRLQPPPNVRDPLAELLVWPHGTIWQDDPAGVRLADGTFVPLGAQFTAAGGFHNIDQLVDGGHHPDVAERARSCARGDVDVAAYVQGEVTIIDSGASAGVSVADAETIVSAFLDLANQPSPDAAERLPFADQVQLGLGRALHHSRSAAELADPSAWIIDEEYFRAASGPFSALDMAAGSQDTVVSVGEHTHCASPPVPPPSDVAALARVSVQPDPERIGSCLQWWTVDFFVNATGNIEAVTLDFWEP